MKRQRSERDAALRKLSQRLGVETQYHDQYGNWHQVPEATLRSLCDALGAAGTESRDGRRLPGAIVVTARRTSTTIQLSLDDAAHRRRWTLREENGTEHRGELIDRRALRLPASLPPGYHHLELSGRSKSSPTATALIMVPARAYMPAQLRSNRVWGISSQLYALRSPRNWGIGDFSDLDALVVRAAALGADVVGINPLHALFPEEPERASPYSPSSRLFVNPLYLDIEAIEDFAECPEVQQLTAISRFSSRRRKLQNLPLVDYRAVARLKRDALRLLHLLFRQRHLQRRGDGRAAEFRAYQKRAGPALRRFATFHVLRESLAGSDKPRAWHDWPQRWRDPNDPAVAEFARRHLDEIECLEYQQWQAERQLARAAHGAREMPMAIGLYQDLAVGFDPDGADAWAAQDIVARGWTIGAPPDAWSPKGQDWGLSPLNPRRLQASGYASFIETLRANMRHAGALRIDHILGLKRLFWVPDGGVPADGAYVRYPFADLLGIVALESVRQRCLVVGEDLGTVPPGFSAQLQRRSILSYRLLYFTRDAHNKFLPPNRYPRQALAAISTHDLPTFTGYWHGDDIALRKRLALYPEKSDARRDAIARATDRRALIAALKRSRLATRPGEMPLTAVHRFLARTPSLIVIAQIEDLLGVHQQVNVPGTVDQHPNWRRKLPLSVDALPRHEALCRTASAIVSERPSPRSDRPDVPRATYRLQLNADFPFSAAANTVPYLARLGVSHLYLSPILEAQTGSTHGYDTTSFDRLNPDLDGSAGFERLADVARDHGLKLLVDFVPNHMGIGQARNDWWLDVLEWGRLSPTAEIFDIDWTPAAWPELRDRLTVPLLGDEYRKVLARGELTLRFKASEGSFAVWYHEHCFPIRPFDYPELLKTLSSEASRGAAHELRHLAASFARLPRTARARDRAADLKTAVARWASKHLKPVPTVPSLVGISLDALDALLQRQVYDLTFWRSAASRINYRRFFDINTLASIRMERPAVFERCHRLIAQLITEDKVHGLRLDHVDGLYDPAEYVRGLRRMIGKPFYLIVEKILGSDEQVRTNWPVDGTTGYEFANWVNGLFIDPSAARPLARTYRQFTGQDRNFADEVRGAKRQVVQQLFGGDLTALVAAITHLESRRRYSHAELTAALTAIIAEFPIYRTYIGQHSVTAADRQVISGAVARVLDRHRPEHAAALRFAERALTDRVATRRVQARSAAMRFQQLTAPVQAKAVEDTAFYRYARLISLNEVGGDPGCFGSAPAEFHARLRRLAHNRPHSLLATATHDTKRGEDARARIDVLSEMPAAWSSRVRRWAELNQSLRTDMRGGLAPSRNDEYLIYQTLVGAWPMEFSNGRVPTQLPLRELADRVVAYAQKAAREAKLRTSWLDPDPEYEKACRIFVQRLLDPVRSHRFLQDFSAFIADVARCGALNSLTQVALKLLAPGVPDIYRGCELWDLSLVDPDNRRPVSFDTRWQMLNDMAADPPDLRGLATDWRSGRLKLYLTWRLLALRRAEPALFSGGSYEPLMARGPAAQHVVAFRRRYRGVGTIVATGRWFSKLATEHGAFAPTPDAWRGTALPGALEAKQTACEMLSGRRLASPLRLDELFRELPVAVIRTPP